MIQPYSNIQYRNAFKTNNENQNKSWQQIWHTGVQPTVKCTHNTFRAIGGYNLSFCTCFLFIDGYNTAWIKKKRLQIFGGAGTESVLKEIKQFHECGIITPMDPTNITKE